MWRLLFVLLFPNVSKSTLTPWTDYDFQNIFDKNWHFDSEYSFKGRKYYHSCGFQEKRKNFLQKIGGNSIYNIDPRVSQMIKINFRLQKYEEMMLRYKQLLTYIKSAVTRNHSEKSINSILVRIHKPSSPPI
jgi:hypothetical protein